MPLNIKLKYKKYARTRGTPFEDEIQKELEKVGEMAIRNVVCVKSNLFEFEIDKLIITERGIIPVSCKDHSNYTNFAYLMDNIRDNAKEVEQITEMLKAKKGRLYIKVPEKYKEKVKKKLARRVYKNVKINIK